MVLTATLQVSGFVTVAAKRREHPYYDHLWALGTVALPLVFRLEQAALNAISPSASTKRGVKVQSGGRQKFS